MLYNGYRRYTSSGTLGSGAERYLVVGVVSVPLPLSTLQDDFVDDLHLLRPNLHRR